MQLRKESLKKFFFRIWIFFRNCISFVYNCDDLPSNNSVNFCFPFGSNSLAYIVITKNYSFFVCFFIRSLYSFGDSPGVS